MDIWISPSCLLSVVIPAAASPKPDMILEDMESDNECQKKPEDQSRRAEASTSRTANKQQEVTEQTKSNSQQHSGINSKPEPSQNVTKISQEDAETQTGRWTPFIERIKREAEDLALATMEER